MSHHLTYYTFIKLDDKNSTSNKNVKIPNETAVFHFVFFSMSLKLIEKS